jgi:NUMOD4 motif
VAEEEWRSVPGYEGFYEVSSQGEVKSLRLYRGTSERILKPAIDSGGYRNVKLWKDKKVKSFRIHELVAMAFLPPRPEGMEVCHGPAGRTDDSAANLSYGTHQQNVGADRKRDGTDNGGSRNGQAKLTDEQVAEVRRRCSAGESQRAVAAGLGIGQATVSNIMTGWTWKEDLPEIKFAEFPQRQCREPQSPDGLVDHWCSLAELHPGPCCPRTLPAAIVRRAQWEAANPGWEQMARDSDPFAPFNQIPGVVLWSRSIPSSRCGCG